MSSTRPVRVYELRPGALRSFRWVVLENDLPAVAAAVRFSRNDSRLSRTLWRKYWQLQTEDRRLKIESALKLHCSFECIHMIGFLSAVAQIVSNYPAAVQTWCPESAWGR